MPCPRTVSHQVLLADVEKKEAAGGLLQGEERVRISEHHWLAMTQPRGLASLDNV